MVGTFKLHVNRFSVFDFHVQCVFVKWEYVVGFMW